MFTKPLRQQRSGPEMVYIGNVAIQIISNKKTLHKHYIYNSVAVEGINCFYLRVDQS